MNIDPVDFFVVDGSNRPSEGMIANHLKETFALRGGELFGIVDSVQFFLMDGVGRKNNGCSEDRTRETTTPCFIQAGDLRISPRVEGDLKPTQIQWLRKRLFAKKFRQR